jgi:hypothetical protein
VQRHQHCHHQQCHHQQQPESSHIGAVDGSWPLPVLTCWDAEVS